MRTVPCVECSALVAVEPYLLDESEVGYVTPPLCGRCELRARVAAAGCILIIFALALAAVVIGARP